MTNLEVCDFLGGNFLTFEDIFGKVEFYCGAKICRTRIVRFFFFWFDLEIIGVAGRYDVFSGLV